MSAQEVKTLIGFSQLSDKWTKNRQTFFIQEKENEEDETLGEISTQKLAEGSVLHFSQFYPGQLVEWDRLNLKRIRVCMIYGSVT